jgi:hypothetical protein
MQMMNVDFGQVINHTGLGKWDTAGTLAAPQAYCPVCVRETTIPPEKRPSRTLPTPHPVRPATPYSHGLPLL